MASIESVKTVLDHPGEEEAVRNIEWEDRKILSEGKFKTRDMSGKHSTSERGDAIQKAILK